MLSIFPTGDPHHHLGSTQYLDSICRVIKDIVSTFLFLRVDYRKYYYFRISSRIFNLRFGQYELPNAEGASKVYYIKIRNT